MKYLKFLFLPVFCLAFISCATAQVNQQNKSDKNKPTEKSGEKKMKKEVTACEPTPLVAAGNEIKIIAEGVFGKVEQPFLFVARSAASFKQIQNLVENMPTVGDIDFDKTAVVAAFGGEKRTGGYSVAIEKSGEKILIRLNEPPPDAITTDALTYPFQLALVSVEDGAPLNLQISDNWTKAAQTYRVSSGEIAYSGGITGKGKSYGVEGTVSVLTINDLATFMFNLTGKGADKSKKLVETVSGTINNGKVDLNRLDVGDFSENPKPPVRISGTLANGKLSLNLSPLPTNIADGFMAEGKIEAVKN